MVELKGVSKSYKVGTTWNRVLRDISVVFPTDVSVGVLGLNGAGKSTLLRLIGGTEPPDRGTIRKDVRVSWPIAFGGGIHPSLTGRESARFVARIYGESPRKVERFAEEFTELGPYFDMQTKTYSSGMKARLNFALSMACSFDCYLVDETTAVGDRRFTVRYKEAFQQRLKNASVLMVSHNPGTIRDFCTKGAVLHNGRLQMYDSVQEAMAAYSQFADSEQR
jgi:capsular polysaccharide transport system ATP-binding protein